MYIGVKTCWSVFYISAFSIFIFIYLLYPLLRGIYIYPYGISVHSKFLQVQMSLQKRNKPIKEGLNFFIFIYRIELKCCMCVQLNSMRNTVLPLCYQQFGSTHKISSSLSFFWSTSNTNISICKIIVILFGYSDAYWNVLLGSCYIF